MARRALTAHHAPAEPTPRSAARAPLTQSAPPACNARGISTSRRLAARIHQDSVSTALSVTRMLLSRGLATERQLQTTFASAMWVTTAPGTFAINAPRGRAAKASTCSLSARRAPTWSVRRVQRATRSPGRSRQVPAPPAARPMASSAPALTAFTPRWNSGPQALLRFAPIA